MKSLHRRLRWALLGAFYAVIITAAILLPLRMLAPLVENERRPGSKPTSLPETPAATVSGALIPTTYRQGEMEVLPVTFPDGTTAEIAYPPELDLADMGLRPYISGCGSDFNLLYGVDPSGTWYEGDAPLKTYSGSGGRPVELWDGIDRNTAYLVFRFGSWTVLMHDRGLGHLADSERAACAAALEATETDAGFLVLGMADLRHGATPLAKAGEHAGPEMMLGDLDPGVVLYPGPCTTTEDTPPEPNGDNQTFAAWCLPGGNMRVHVYEEDDGRFIEAVRRGLEVRNLVLAN